MQSPQTEPAPFARGDRVIFRPRPAGIETVEAVEWSNRGWAGWYVQTARPFGRHEHLAHRWAPAIEFNRLDLGDIGGLPEGGARRGCSSRAERPR